MNRREQNSATHSRDEGRRTLSQEQVELRRLEVETMMALAGLRKNPEQIVAALLEHPADLHPELRFRIAQALRGSGDGISLVATGQKKTGWARTWLEKQASVVRGEKVKALQKERPGYEEAVEFVALKSGKGKKTVEADVALSNRVASWVREKLVERNDSYDTDPHLVWPAVLTTVFLQAEAKKEDPDEYLQAQYALHGGATEDSAYKLMRSLYPEITRPLRP